LKRLRTKIEILLPNNPSPPAETQAETDAVCGFADQNHRNNPGFFAGAPV